MKKILVILFLILFILPVSAKDVLLQAGVSIDEVPKALYGTWRINAKQENTNAPRTFKPQSIDSWGISRRDDYLTLENPMTGAKSTISVKTVEGNLISFCKKTDYDNNKVLTDTVTIRLEDNKFHGINNLVLETYSSLNGRLIKSETATYRIQGEKIYGDSVLK